MDNTDNLVKYNSLKYLLLQEGAEPALFTSITERNDYMCANNLYPVRVVFSDDLTLIITVSDNIDVAQRKHYKACDLDKGEES